MESLSLEAFAERFREAEQLPARQLFCMYDTCLAYLLATCDSFFELPGALLACTSDKKVTIFPLGLPVQYIDACERMLASGYTLCAVPEVLAGTLKKRGKVTVTDDGAGADLVMPVEVLQKPSAKSRYYLRQMQERALTVEGLPACAAQMVAQWEKESTERGNPPIAGDLPRLVSRFPVLAAEAGARAYHLTADGEVVGFSISAPVGQFAWAILARIGKRGVFNRLDLRLILDAYYSAFSTKLYLTDGAAAGPADPLYQHKTNLGFLPQKSRAFYVYAKTKSHG